MLPFIHSHIAVMPDVHYGIGATVGSVIPTKGAIIPAAVGVDIGCGMMAMRTSLTANDLPDSLSRLRGAIERNVPHGNGPNGNHREAPATVETTYRNSGLDERYERIIDKHPKASAKSQTAQLATLGGGNHFLDD
jgi:tRNA-splicing ligase RtcB